MASLKELRDRITSVKATQKITKAMRMVAAAKLRLAQEAALSARPYADRIRVVLSDLAPEFRGKDDAPRLMTGTGHEQKHLVVLCTAERGLCGGFNSSLVKTARNRVRMLLSEGKEVQILCVGRKGFEALRQDFQEQILDVIAIEAKKAVPFSKAAEISERVLALFEGNAFDVAWLCYARFRSVILQEPQFERLIPFDGQEQGEDKQGEWSSGARWIYDYEPNQGEILGHLLVRNLSAQIFRALLENAASEQGARMSAMDNATRNAGEMIGKLTLSYNRERQAKITNELIEIISGAEAL